MTLLQAIFKVFLIGVGATAIMDLWLALLRRFGVQGLNFALLGRWVGHLARGTLVHPAIAKAAAIRDERVLGWGAHYAVGVAFAALLVAVFGVAWLERPTVLPAVLLGVATVVAPLFVMQPAMGAGFAASKTPTPLKNCVRSVVNHAVFGLGLYLSALVLVALAP
ncbi:DUF2938 domain-containing protein [Denitromonas iodatirespirans]|uniref:DUF2938 domain-containing protein n=1 Tax=Denitromonas iodatirespirans TaxID=2795389 RepID=A0A944DA54_DENI1|nr:DUF2938 domain-containing protein [Denitromonas iodatirespirans]MBT0960692.1 DUF2938 domain-containing protein [Denitromonas iodatirespirans]